MRLTLDCINLKNLKTPHTLLQCVELLVREVLVKAGLFRARNIQAGKYQTIYFFHKGMAMWEVMEKKKKKQWLTADQHACWFGCGGVTLDKVEGEKEGEEAGNAETDL